MFKKIITLFCVCALAGCSKDSIHQLDAEDHASYVVLDSPDFEESVALNQDGSLNGVFAHTSACVSSSKIPVILGGALGTYAYPYEPSMTPMKLFRSSLPCQPNIPYFIYSHMNSEGNSKTGHSVTYRLTLNPFFFNDVKVVDVEWEFNGKTQSSLPRQLIVDNLKANQTNSVICRVFATSDNAAVYSQELEFDFKVLLDLLNGSYVNYESGYSYACTNTGLAPIIAP